MKIMKLLKRKAGISHTAFVDHYENSHVVLAHRYLGHLFVDYRRNYPLPVTERVGETPNSAVADSPFDAITEIWLEDHEAWFEMQRIIADPVIGMTALVPRRTDRDCNMSWEKRNAST